MEATETIDFTIQGECSRCGSCCTNYLPVTSREFRKLKVWAIKHSYSPKKVEDVLDVTCPFYDKEEKKCVCYDIRPSVCRAYTCHNFDPLKLKLPYRRHKYEVKNLRREIFNEEVLSYQEWLAVADYIKNKGGTINGI